MSSLVGDRIKELRERKRLSQGELAAKLGYTTRHYQRFENEDLLPKDSVLAKIAYELEANLQELQELLDRDRDVSVTERKSVRAIAVVSAPEMDLPGDTTATAVPDTSQVPGIALDSTPIAPVEKRTFEETAFAAPMPVETADPPVQPAHTERKRQPNWLVLNLTLITVAILVTAGIVFWALIGENMFNTISGQITCPDNQPVAGIWINPVNGGGNYATLQFQNSSASVAKFTYILPNGGGYDVHAGCSVKPAGGWAKTYWTERCSGSIEDRAFHTFTIYDQPPADKSKPCLVRYGQ